MQLQEPRQAVQAGLACLKKVLATVPIEALGLSWRSVFCVQPRTHVKLRIARAQVEQVNASLAQLRSLADSLEAHTSSLLPHLGSAPAPGPQTTTTAADGADCKDGETGEGGASSSEVHDISMHAQAAAAAAAAAQEQAVDRISQMRAIAFALERVLPELEDMVEELDIDRSSHKPNEPLCFTSQPHFTCPVCFDDKVSVQDAFVVSACGHPICRPCALRSVDFNIKQLQPQVCPTCMGAPCPCCPITIWHRTRDLQGRRSRRRVQRRAELHTDRDRPQSREGTGEAGLAQGAAAAAQGGAQGHRRRRQRTTNHRHAHGANNGEGANRAGGSGQGAAPPQQAAEQPLLQLEPGSSGNHRQQQQRQQRQEQQEQQRQQQQQEQEQLHQDGLPEPQVKHCCMSQADMRLLLQPEELQRQQLEFFARRRQAREQRRQREQAWQQQQTQQQTQKQQQQEARSRKRHRSAAAAAAAAGVARQQLQPGQAGPAARKKQVADAGTMQGSEPSSIVIDSDDELPTAAAEGGVRLGGGSSSHGCSEALESAAAAAAAAAAATAARDRAEEEEEAAEMPPSYEAYLKAEALRAVHSGGLFKLCPSCGEGIELVASGNERNRLRCPTCKADKCLSCGVDWHENSTCEQYQQWSRENAQADEEFKKLVAQGEIQPCPRCGIAVTKEPGYCDHMRCKCGCYYCYKCGKEKTGEYIRTHGCPCMNGAAWRHDWRALLPPGDPRLPPLPGVAPPPAPAAAAHRNAAPAGAPARGHGVRPVVPRVRAAQAGLGVAPAVPPAAAALAAAAPGADRRGRQAGRGGHLARGRRRQ